MRALKWIFRIAGVGLVCLLGYLAQLYYFGNFHEVVPGKLYRAAQVSPADIARYSRQEGIRSILNLRGADPGASWYEEELAASAANGVEHADFHMSSSEIVTAQKAQALVDLMREMPKPMLIHCERGADRSGLASALYVAAIEGAGENASERQLSIRFGHFSVPYLSAAYPMDESWEELEPVLGFGES